MYNIHVYVLCVFAYVCMHVCKITARALPSTMHPQSMQLRSTMRLQFRLLFWTVLLLPALLGRCCAQVDCEERPSYINCVAELESNDEGLMCGDSDSKVYVSIIHTQVHCTHIHTHIYIHTYTHTFTYIHTHTHIHTCIHTCTYIHTHTCTYIHTHTYTCTYGLCCVYLCRCHVKPQQPFSHFFLFLVSVVVCKLMHTIVMSLEQQKQFFASKS